MVSMFKYLIYIEAMLRKFRPLEETDPRFGSYPNGYQTQRRDRLLHFPLSIFVVVGVVPSR